MTTKRKRERFVAWLRFTNHPFEANTFFAQIREGFIVDEDEDEEEEGGDSDGDVRPVVKRKREHRDREQEEALDEDDLELIGEQFGERPKPPTQVSSDKQNWTIFCLVGNTDTRYQVQVQTSEARPSRRG